MITRLPKLVLQPSTRHASHKWARSLKGLLLGSCLLLAGYAPSHAQDELSPDEPSYGDVQACTNAYNHSVWAVESIKSDLRGNPDAQITEIETELTKSADPAFHFEIDNLPGSGPIAADGIPAVSTALAALDNYGEHHVTSPFSVKEVTSTVRGTRAYQMTTRDLDYVNVPAGGCEVYLSQKDVSCTIGDKPLIKSIVDNVVTSHHIDSPACADWKAAPVTPYVD